MAIKNVFLAKSAISGTALSFRCAAVVFLLPPRYALHNNYSTRSLTLGGPIVVNLDITTGVAEGVGSAITAVTGTVGGDAVTFRGTVVTPPGSNTSPNGEWIYDNVVYTALNSPYGTAFDNPGLLLLNSAGNEINIFSPGVYAAAQDTLGVSPGLRQQANLFLSFRPLRRSRKLWLACRAVLRLTRFRPLAVNARPAVPWSAPGSIVRP